MGEREPWVRSDGTFDAVALQRHLRDKLTKRREGLSPEEQIRWIREAAERFRARRGAGQPS